jgi:hypothetical protein
VCSPSNSFRLSSLVEPMMGAVMYGFAKDHARATWAIVNPFFRAISWIRSLICFRESSGLSCPRALY